MNGRIIAQPDAFAGRPHTSIMFPLRYLLSLLAGALSISLALRALCPPVITVKTGAVSKELQVQIFYEREGKYSEANSVWQTIRPPNSSPPSIELSAPFALPHSFAGTEVSNLRIDLGDGTEDITLREITISSLLYYRTLSPDEIVASFAPAPDVAELLKTSDGLLMKTRGPDPWLNGNSSGRAIMAEADRAARWSWIGIVGLLFVIGIIGRTPLGTFLFAASCRTFPCVVASQRREIITIGSVFSGLSIVLLWPFLTFGYLYMYLDVGFDTYAQNWAYFTHWCRQWTVDGLLYWPFWSFETGIGTNIGPFLNDPFTMLLFPFGERAMVSLFPYVAVIKSTLTGLVFYHYLSYLRLDRPARLFGALFYTFSGFAVVWGQYYNFATFSLYLALILWGFERYLATGKFYALIAGFGLLSLLVIVWCALTGVFMLFYSNARFFMERRPLLASNFKFLALSVLGCGIGAVLGLPYVLSITESARSSSLFTLQVPLLNTERIGDLTVLARLMSNDLMGTGNSFWGKGFSGRDNYFEAPTIYCGVLTLLLVPQFFWASERRQRWALGLLLALFFVSMFSPLLRTFLNLLGPAYLREVSLFFVTVMVVVGSVGLNQISKKGETQSALLLGSLILILAFVCWGHNLTDSGRDGFSAEAVKRVIFFATSYTVLLFALRGAKWRELSGSALLLLLCVEVVSMSYPALHNRVRAPIGVLENRSEYFDGVKEAVAELKRMDPEPFRVEKNFRSVFFSDAVFQDYYGFDSYFPLNSASYVRFLRKVGVLNAEGTVWTIDGLADRWGLYNFLGARFYLTKGDAPGAPNTVLKKEFGTISAYENHDARALVRMVYYSLAEEEFSVLPQSRQDRILNDAVVLTDEHRDLGNLSPAIVAGTEATFEVGERAHLDRFENDGIEGTVKARKDGMLFFAVPFNRGWQLILDGVSTPLTQVSFGFMGVPITAGDHRFELRFVPPGLWLGVGISLLSIVLLTVWGIAPRMRS